MTTTPRSEALLSRLEHFGLKLGLERVRGLLGDLGDPHLAVPTVLVAGTNGKGSTAAMLAAATRRAGYRTGLFVSPHLETLAERISVSGAPISDDALHHHLGSILDIAEEIRKEPPTFFEAMTLAAFLHYRAEECDLAVFEVGLGGRLDATNVCEPMVSVVTSIGLDHQGLLGSTLTAIAGEKAGIARSGRPLIAWAEPAEVHDALEERCREVGAVYVPAQELVTIRPGKRAEVAAGQRARVSTPAEDYTAELSLPGIHQLRNFALVALVAEHLADRFPALDRTSVEDGAANTFWPARLEWVDLPDDRRVLIDAGHNPAGIATLLEHLDAVQPGPFDLLFGAVGDKSIADMLPPLAARAERILLTRPPTKRSGDPRDWLDLVPDHGHEIDVVPEPLEALDLALGRLEAGAVLVMTGSIYLLGDLRRDIRRRFGVPPATV